MDSLRPGSAQFYSQPSGQCHGVNKLTPEVAAAYDAPYPFMIHNLGNWIISGLIGGLIGVSLTILIQVGGARLRKYLRELNETGEKA
jgi:hypothetical protein